MTNPTDMTRADIFAMGVATQQLGIRDQDELAEMARFYYVSRYRVELALRATEQAIRSLEGI